MKIERIGNAKIIMSNPDSLHNYFAWPSIVRLQNGKIAVAASGYRLNHLCPFGKAVISYSEDNGETYTVPAPVIDTPLDDRDAGLCTFGDKGLIFTSFNNTREVQRWWKHIDINYRDAYLNLVDDQAEKKYLGSTFRISNDCGVTFGPIHISPITSPHGPIETKSGKIVWVGRPFSDAANPLTAEEDRIKAYEIHLDGSMEFIGTIPPIIIDGKQICSCEPHMIELDNGRLLCHIRANEIFTTFQSVSDDGGKTWSEPVRLLDDFAGSPPHILKHSSGALICVYGRREDPLSIRAMFSFDDGETWDTEHEICPLSHTGDHGYPMSVELDDGSILTVFYAHPEADGPAVIMQQKWRFEK